MNSLLPASGIVLVVEDDALLRLAAVDVIQCAGFETLEASSADEALSILMARPDIRIVFTDVQMPGSIDGIELAAIIEQRWPNIGVIVSSGLARPEIVVRAPNAAFLAKPYDPEALTPLLAKHASPCAAATPTPLRAG